MVSVTPYGGDPEEAGREEVRDLIWNWPPRTWGSGVGERLPANGVGVRKRRAGRATAQRFGAQTGEEKLSVTEQRKDPASSLHERSAFTSEENEPEDAVQSTTTAGEPRMELVVAPRRVRSSERSAGSVLTGLSHGTVPAPRLHSQTRPTANKQRSNA